MAECLGGVRRGDQDAVRRLVAHLEPVVWRVVRSHRTRRTGEEDLVQMVFMKVFAKLDQYRGPAPLAHWVSRIAVNTCLNQIESERVRPELRLADLSEEEEQVIQTLASTEEELEPGHSVASKDLLDRLMERLSPEDQMVIRLVHLEGYSLEEVRQKTGWNIALIKVRAFRARGKLRKHLEFLMKERQS
ncbi:MAG: RNA polymerase sigma factor [Verrucomicrobia bacterium]|nr:RNA polymerase sigma factor [Verrucomicrobiota bacterium]